MKNVNWRTITILVALGLSAVFFSEMPISEKDSNWGHNVLRNWGEIGFFKLGGQLVTNPGGVLPGDRIEIYGGHRPYGLYFPFIIGKVGGGFGGEGMAFYIAFSAVVAFATYCFPADRTAALMGALLVLMCPGYVRMAVNVDTLTVPVLLGLPFLAPICRRFSNPQPIGFGVGALIALVIAVYAFLNWTTAFVFLIVGLYLLARIGPFNRRLVLFSLAAIAVIAAVGIVSVASKLHRESSGGGAHFDEFYNSYLWGAGGYAGYPMNWTTAIIRLCAANLLGLLPILVFFIWTLVRHGKPPGRLAKMLLPLAGSLICVAFMRNYFAHHPWMAASVLIVGLLFSLELVCWKASGMTVPQKPARFKAAQLFCTVCAGVYCLAVVALFKVNSAESDRLIALIKENTPRNSVILLGNAIDTSGLQQVERFALEFDRTVFPSLDGWKPKAQDDAGRRVFLLANEALPSLGTPAAQTRDDTNPLTGAFLNVLTWYRTHIAKRSATDRLTLNRSYYLYAQDPVTALKLP